MFEIITLILGIVFVLLACKAILSTIVCLGKIALGLILMGLSYIADGCSWIVRKISLLQYYATIELTHKHWHTSPQLGAYPSRHKPLYTGGGANQMSRGNRGEGCRYMSSTTTTKTGCKSSSPLYQSRSIP